MTAERPLVLGHRGYRARYPENTLLAFREALRAGAHGIECDLQKTKDGRFVVIHDPRTGRTADSDRGVAESSLEELRGLDFGRGERIPTLQELLSVLPADAWLDLELKEETLTPADCAEISAILDSTISREKLMVSSFDARLLFPMKARGFLVGYLVGEEVAGRWFAFAATLLRLRPRYVNLPIDMTRVLGVRRARRAVQALRVLGFRLLFWTVNTPAEAGFAAPAGDFLVTDEVDLIVQASGKRALQK